MTGYIAVDGRVGLPEGTLLDGSYRIERVIGSGGFGITYEAEDMKLGTKIAIKEYFPGEFGRRDDTGNIGPTSEKQKVTFEWGRTSFLREARTLARFRHPNVVQVTRVFEAYSTAYMVMVFEEGASLETWLKRLGRSPTQEELDSIAGPILDALGMMHAQSFIHRDIAPDNIIVRPDGTPVLLDFGAARVAIAEMTKAITGIIKAGYSPQEQYTTDARLQGPWTDIYAFGATLYRGVTGEAPEESTLRAIDDRMHSAVSAGEGKYRPGFLEAIDACLEVHHADRPQSVAQVRSMLLTQPAREIPPPAAIAPRIETREIGAAKSARLPLARPSTKVWRVIFFAAVIAVVGSGLFGGQQYMRWQTSEGRRVEPKAAGKPEKEVVNQNISGAPKVTVGPNPQYVTGSRPKRAAQNRVLTIEEELGVAFGQEFKECPTCPEMVVVPAGSFMMGSPESEASERERAGDETQVHATIARLFAVGKFAVSFDEWDACVAEGGCNGYRPGDQGWGRAKRPVINVNWDDAKAYAKWLSQKTGKIYRLLSEAEREYVTRAGTKTPFWWGSSITPKQANYDGSAEPYKGGGSKGEYRKATLPVDSFDANPWGLYQVHGNVWEWTEDCWNDTNRGNPGNGSARTSGDCNRRVVRGGSWDNSPRSLRAAYRFGDTAIYRYGGNGFRLARTLETAAAAVAPEAKRQLPRPSGPPMVPVPGVTIVLPPQAQAPARAADPISPPVEIRVLTPEEERHIAPRQEFQECKDCPRMVVVSAGSFIMGSPSNEEGRLGEDPQHKVTIAKSFAVGQFEVTFAEWDACAIDGGCKGRPNDFGTGRGKRPVIDVSWADAKDYATWLSKRTGRPYRLPSEAEWEYAARAGTMTAFSTGRTITTDQANFDGNSTYAGSAKGVYRGKTVEVGSLNKPNAFGLHDMHGNVWEWVQDCYQVTYAYAPSDGRASLDFALCSRVVRGGSWSSSPEGLRSAHRGRMVPDVRSDDIGFRVARTIESPLVAPLPPLIESKARIEELLAQATQRIEAGDVVGAREILVGADDGAQGPIAFALAETYDPYMLAAWGARGVPADVAKARALYRKASALGVARAQARLDALK